MSDPSEEFLAVDISHRWTRTLGELGEVLNERAWKAQGRAVWYVLPNGACVSMRVIDAGPDAFRRELRISRRGIKKDDASLFLAEVKVFKARMALEKWCEPQPGCVAGFLEREIDRATFRGIAIILEPRAEPAPPEVCVRCGKPASKGSYKEPVCDDCARAAGAAEVAQATKPPELLP